MRITSSIEYATRLMVALAAEHGNAPVSAERLADSGSVAVDYVSQILVKLRRGGLVVSHRGSAGGYALSRSPAEITLAQVVRAVDGAVFEETCDRYKTGTKDCRHQGQCAISPVWTKLADLVTGYFESVTLAAILDQKTGACGSAPDWLEKLASGK